MRSSTSAVQELSSNSLEMELSEEDAKFLLKALEKQAFEYILYAFRAQGPLTKYKELILEHLKSALFITDQEFSLNLRIAANNPHLNEIVQKLNPSYDNFSEWLAAGLDLTGAEMANSRRLQLNNSNLSDRSGQILREIRRHNRNLSRESVAASEAIAELYQLPKRPFMPERLRKLLRDTESDGLLEGIETKKDNKTSELIPPTTTAIKSQENETTKTIKKRNVGRPRKYPRKDEINNNEQTKQQKQITEETQKQQEKQQEKTQTNNNNNFNNCFKGKICWGKRRPNRWKDLNNNMEERTSNSPSIIPINSSMLSEENLKNSSKIGETTKTNCLPIQLKYVQQPSTSNNNNNNCSNEAMENLADLALAQMAEFPLISSASLMPPPPSSSNSTQIYINNQKSTNESFHKIDQNDCNSSEQIVTDGTPQLNACARVRPFVFEREIQQQCRRAENQGGNFRSSSSPLPLHTSSSNFKNDFHPVKTNKSITTTFISSPSYDGVELNIIDDDHSYERNNSISNSIEYLDEDYMQIENNDQIVNNQQQKNGLSHNMNLINNNNINFVSSVLDSIPTTSFATKIIQNIPVIAEESGLDFLASTASLLKPIEMNNTSESVVSGCTSSVSLNNNKTSRSFNEQKNNNKRHSTINK